MKVLLVVGLVALAGAATARADTPAGFAAAPKLNAAASYVAGKPVSVYCAPTMAALASVAANHAQDIQGVTPVVGGTVVYLSPATCSFLSAWLAGKRSTNLYGTAGSLQTLAHEAEHTKGLSDETDADCAALAAMPGMVSRFFPLHGRTTLHKLMTYAWGYHQSKPAVYQTHAC